jgi:ribosomal protein S14
MKANKVKNQYQRLSFKDNEINLKLEKFIFVNLLNEKVFKTKPSVRYFFSTRNFKNISKVKFKNMCVLTGRNRSVEKSLSLSRIQLRHMISFGIIPGYSKSVW